ncbi:MAG: heat-inducible transcriptional repressor HrcA [Desulfarculaceae bacterium]|nr:heat-inducible transcriptional repressor HrcA [Desulfarculaceae bacterium]MCF8073417.1 heat-inducible transcriptional repressor HrcA [Desulfarculaceae bacterium]MCF8100436.1 heat-inducible transcriptional repressor HrcA [Desulfarculaceae bacterium]MCF8115828.1 heat-inducible transcriptional repressor HrcA [Desulfarculaceae bacterium]
MADDLSQRARLVLASVVATYIATAEPVGSRTISKQENVSFSAATIRNVMADLEGMGFLTQPHVSAGRIPTPDGMRFYVESILELDELDESVKQAIRSQLSGHQLNDLNDIFKATSRALSQISRQASLVAVPSPEQEVFRHMEFVRLAAGLILVVLVSKAGGVQNRIIEAEEDISQEELDKYSRYLNDLLADLTLSQVKQRVAQEMAQERNRFDAVLSRALTLGKQALSSRSEGDLLVDGQSNLMDQPEFRDVVRLRGIFQAFEEKSTLLRLLDKALTAQGVRLLIGSESEQSELEGLSLVTSAYGDQDQPMGALGIIGPTRMDYSKVIPMVDFTARVVSRILDERAK